MAEKILNTRIQLKIDTLANWNASSLVLKKGEVAVATIPTGDTSGVSRQLPATLMKIGDGTHTFADLPWMQGIAADVATWAKANNKPTYAATEITGLENYINTTIQDTDTQYTITKVDDYNYKLMSKAKGASSFTTEVATLVIPNKTSDIEALQELVGNTAVATQITNAINGLDKKDTAAAGQFVTAVSEENGIITVSRAALKESDVPALGIAKVTGLQNALNAKQDTVAFQGAYDKTNNKAATMADVTSAVAGLSGAMHFKGVVTAIPPTSGTYASGDVVVFGNKEYVYDGTTWHELGDETIYAVKGSIVNADIAANAAIDKSKIAGLGTMASETASNYVTKTAAPGYDDILTATTAAETYVAKNGTDRLMTAAEGTKLAGIAANAQVNVLEGIKVGTSNATITNKVAQLGALAGKSNVAEGDLASALATKINGKANDADLAAIAKSGNVKDLVQTAGDVLVFDCGTSTTVV